MPLIKSKSKEAFKSNIKAEKEAGKPRDQALAIAFRVQREAKAAGGPVIPLVRRPSPHGPGHLGFIHSNVAGRTDKLPMKLRSGSYVIPAATVSSVGQGNSVSGANALDRLFTSGPYGSSKSMTPYGSKEIGAPKTFRRAMRFADGGDVQPVDVIVAGGEYIVSPEQVAKIGDGDIQKGHEILDEFVKHIKRRTIQTLKKLPGPKNG